MGSSFFRAAGGKGANQAVAAARLGAEVSLVARVGADDLGRSAVEAYRSEGIDTTYVAVDPQAPSGVALIVVDDRGENAITVAPGANDHLSIGEVEQAREVIAGAQVLLLQLETPLEPTIRALEIARQAGTCVVLNPAPARALSREVLSLVDFLTPNESEARALAEALNPSDPDQRVPSSADDAASLVAGGARTVLVTRGASGVLWAEDGGASRLLPASNATVLDSTGAGDAFNGALAVALARGDDLEPAIDFAQRAAGWSVGKLGAQPSFPRLADLL